MRTIKEIVDANKCTGCGACKYSCPTNAIQFKQDELDCFVAKIEENCIHCGKCLTVCPQNGSFDPSIPQKCYAGYAIEKEGRNQYSSGGAASLIANAFIEQKKGAVCGVAWLAKDGIAKHIIADTIEDVELFKGSKYVQSNLQDIYNNIDERIKGGKPVLFIGTPCQVVAVKNIFNSELLYTIDLICHGVPAEAYLQQWLSYLKKERNQVFFRGENDFWLTIKDEKDKIVYKYPMDCDLYFKAFLEGIDYRECCYTCQYANLKRVGDLTLGDFWGLSGSQLSKPYNGRLSCILQNTEKGKALIELVGSTLLLEERTIEEAIKENKQLQAPMEAGSDRIIFKEEYPSKGWIKAIKKTGIYKECNKKKRQFSWSMFKTKIKAIIMWGSK